MVSVIAYAKRRSTGIERIDPSRPSRARFAPEFPPRRSRRGRCAQVAGYLADEKKLTEAPIDFWPVRLACRESYRSFERHRSQRARARARRPLFRCLTFSSRPSFLARQLDRYTPARGTRHVYTAKYTGGRENEFPSNIPVDVRTHSRGDQHAAFAGVTERPHITYPLKSDYSVSFSR